ncbi:MAG: glycosyltransferase [Mangrovicoccus sp.]|nr:glycosyltransferase [Mangrovicoccus sp.]
MTPPPIKLVSSAGRLRQAQRAASARLHGKKRLGEVLLARGLVDDDTLSAALAAQSVQDARLGEILHLEHGLSPEDLHRAVAHQHGLPRVDLTKDPHDPSLVAQYGVGQCLSDHCLPWRRIGACTVVLVDAPAQFETLKAKLTDAFGPVMMGLTDRVELHKALARLHRRELRQRAELRVPEQVSCRDWRGKLFSRLLALFTVCLVIGALAVNDTVLIAVTIWALFTLYGVTCLKAFAMLASLRRPKAQAKVMAFARRDKDEKLPVVSMLVPLLEEDEIAQGLIRNLNHLKYPRSLLDICLVVEADDQRTHEAIARAELPPWMRVVQVPVGDLRTKPRALNYALDFARGSLIGVYDAEDAPDPDQIQRVVAHFRQADPWVACVQGMLDFYNRRQSWLTRCFTLDYAIWFRAVLPGLARLRLPLPLGGTTLFFRRSALEKLGAWDAHNVTEDADLGLRLARAGLRTELLPTVTREQATSQVIPWIRQRSRWLKGYALTYAVHMRNPIQLWRELGGRGFLAFQILFLGTISQYTLAPVLWSWWLVFFGLPHPVAEALPPALTLGVIAGFITCEFISFIVGFIAAHRAQARSLIPWLLTMSFYHMLACIASYKALYEMVARPFYWDKTHHPAACQEDLYAPPEE